MAILLTPTYSLKKKERISTEAKDEFASEDGGGGSGGDGDGSSSYTLNDYIGYTYNINNIYINE